MVEPYYEDNGITIYHGDCREILPTLAPVDLVLTDPPYGIKRDKGFEGFEGFGGFGKPIARRRFEDDNWDSERPAKELFDSLLSKAPAVLIFGGNFFADLLPQGKHWVVWDKKNTMPTFGDCELIWTNIPRNSVKIIVCEYNGLIGKESWRAHPTQKPIRLITSLLNLYHGNTVLDPFMGSGTTLVAAKQLNRKAIGIEIEEKYCEIAVKRLAQGVFDFAS
jgi:DNA modification methylase